ncbi:tryptophan synthase subunit alpha [soil metagenome]
MSPLSARFQSLREKGEKALVLFFTAGDQPLDQLPDILSALEEGGADVIEIGIPFSDPFGEGPTIQASSQRALENGASPSAILAAVAQASVKAPLVTMGYYNTVLRIGLDRFARMAHEAGSSGTIISDLVPDEAGEWSEASARNGLDTIFLVAPTSTDRRMDQVAQVSTGFIYIVSRTGVTGAENQVPADVTSLVAKVKARTDKPCCVGFGLSTPEHVRMVATVADGAVVGSELVKRLHQRWDNGKGRGEIIDFVRALKEATLSA